jgi:hypothetical protein
MLVKKDHDAVIGLKNIPSHVQLGPIMPGSAS